MAIFRYDLKRLSDNIITHSREDDDPNFRFPIPKNWGYNTEGVDYEIIQTDITAEKAQRDQKEIDLRNALGQLKSEGKISGTPSAVELRDKINLILDALGLV